MKTMEMPEIRQRKPHPGSPNVQTSPATDPASEPRPNPIPPPQSSWKRLQVAQWIMLCILLLTITGEAAENIPVGKASNPLDIMMNDAAPEANPKSFHHPRTKEFTHVEICPKAGPCKATTERPANICDSAECDELASDVQAKMNLMIDPCKDFYDHACDRFINENHILGEQTTVSTLTKLADRLRAELFALVSSTETPSDEIKPFWLSKYLYQLCMDTLQIGKDGKNQMLSVLEKLGGWYVLEKGGWGQPKTSWSLVKSVEELRPHNYTNDYFISCSVGVDWKDTSRRSISIDQPTLGLSRKNLARGMDDPLVSAYYKTIVEAVVSLGAEKNRAKLDLREMVDLEIKLAKISSTYSKRQNDTTKYNPMSVQELQSKYPYINWLDYFAVMFKDTGIVIGNKEVIIVKAPGYFERLGSLLQTTSNRTLANYVMWRVITFTSPYLNRNLQERQLIKLNAKEEQYRSDNCVDITRTHLPIAVAAQYVKKYVKYSRRAALEMVSELKNAFLDILKEASWMDRTTRDACLEKVNSMVFHMGYPVELVDDREIKRYYRDLIHKLQLTEDFLTTVLIIKQFNTMQKFKMLRQPVNRNDWTTQSSQVDITVRYSLTQNSVQVPSGLLQGLFAPRGLPSYMNYGAVGTIIGRWITRACDYQGRLSDKDGNAENWWQAATERAYLDKRKCFIDQYDNYTEPYYGIPISGRTTADANIADLGGLRVAFKAYKNWAAHNAPEPRLPWLELSPERMFWISAAQVRCSVYPAEEMIKRITKSSFSPDYFRVVGPIKNMVEFSETFNCTPGSPMNPMKKCKVW